MQVEGYGGIDNLEVLVEAKRYNRFLVDTVVDAGGWNGSALDFGAGTGSISSMVRERDIEVTCVELDPVLRGRLRDLGFGVYADIDAVESDSQPFIYSLNVLEHIEDDEGTLTRILPRMKPGGRFLVYVPALQWLYSSMDRKIGHYRRYHRRDFVHMAERAGFRVERAEYADSLGVLATLAYKVIGSRRGDISLASVRFYDRFIFPISRILDRLGCSRLFGKNLLVVLERPGGAQ
jgi:SAM-dependent methyltransferase